MYLLGVELKLRRKFKWKVILPWEDKNKKRTCIKCIREGQYKGIY